MVRGAILSDSGCIKMQGVLFYLIMSSSTEGSVWWGELPQPFPEKGLKLLTQAVDEHAILAVTNAHGVILHVNDLFCRISGYQREELIGQTHRVIRSDYHNAEFFSDMWKTITAGGVWSGVICNRAKDGSLYWVDSTIVPLIDQGKTAGYLALRSDVTDLKQAQLENERLIEELLIQADDLRLAQGQFAALFNHSSIGISWREMDEDGRPGLNHCNSRFCEIIGLSVKEARDIGNVARATHPDDWREQEVLTREVYAGKRDWFRMTKRYLHANGKIVWASLSVSVLRDKNGRVTHHFAILEDVTSQHEAEEALRGSEARWRTYLETASEILYALTPDRKFKFVSPAWSLKLGHPIAEVLGRSFFDFVHPEDVELCQKFITDVLAGRSDRLQIEYRVKHLDGHWVWHASSGARYSDRNEQNAFFGVGRDISVRRQAQEELRAALKSREELERIVNRSPSVAILWRFEGEDWPVEFVSQSIAQFGFLPEQFTRRELSFLQITHPEDQDRVRAEMQAHFFSGDEEYNQEYRIICADGRVRWIDDHTIVRRNAEGLITHHEGVLTDITERKLAEEREQSMLEREMRMAREVQQHLLPTDFPFLDEVEIDALTQPSRHLGGDYFDVLKIDEHHYGFVVADVSGKGAPAALMMAACRSALRLAAERNVSPRDVLIRLNRSLRPDMPPRMFITLFYAVLDKRNLSLRYCRCGHEAGLLIKPGHAQACLMEKGGFALGMMEDELFAEGLEEGEILLEEGDLVVLYSDGVNEATNGRGEEFGRDRMVEVFARFGDQPLGKVLQRLDRHLRQFSALAPREDDRTLLLLRRRRKTVD